MNIEIVEFYPIDRNIDKEALRGTLRIKLLDFGFQILGISVNKQKDRWFFSLPGRQAKHHETGQMVRYPYFSFEDKNKQREFIEAIRQQAPAFIEKRIADTERPLVWPEPVQQKQSKQVEHLAKSDNAVNVKEKKRSIDSK